MKFFRILADVKWRLANDCSAWAARSPARECVMPPIACPVCGSAARGTRNPGFCYPAVDVSRFSRALEEWANAYVDTFENCLDYVSDVMELAQQRRARFNAHQLGELVCNGCFQALRPRSEAFRLTDLVSDELLSGLIRQHYEQLFEWIGHDMPLNAATHQAQ